MLRIAEKRRPGVSGGMSAVIDQVLELMNAGFPCGRKPVFPYPFGRKAGGDRLVMELRP